MKGRSITPVTREGRRRIAVIGTAALVLALLSLLAASCGGTSSGTTTTTPTTGGTSTSPAGGGAQVVLKGFAFSPATVTIKAGESVTWINEDSANHTVVGDGGEFKSGDLANGDTFSFKFDTAGTYAYHCTIHPSMKATVVVE